MYENLELVKRMEQRGQGKSKVFFFFLEKLGKSKDESVK